MMRLIVVFLMMVVCLPFVNAKLVYELQNSGFEQGFSGWSVRHGYSIDTTVFRMGNASIRSNATFWDPAVDNNSGDARAMWVSGAQVPAVKVGQRIFAGAWMKAESANCSYGVRIGIDLKNKTNNVIVHAVNGGWVYWGNDWTYKKVSVMVRPGDEKATLWLQTKTYNCSGVAWFDDVSMVIEENDSAIPDTFNRTKMEVGIIPNWKLGETFLGFEQNHNVTVDRFMQYFDLDNEDGVVWAVHDFLQKSCRDHVCELGIEFNGDGVQPSPLKGILEGRFDGALYRIAGELGAYNKTVYIRPLPEFLGWWTHYGVYNVNNSRDDLVPAFRYVVDALRSGGNEKVKVEWNVGGMQGWEPYEVYYPGDGYVDESTVDMYNVPSISGKTWISFYDLLKPSYDELVRVNPNIPVNIGETGSHSAGGNKSQWIKDAFTDMIYNFTHLTNIDFFFVDYGYGNTSGDVDLNNVEEEAAFKTGIARIREYNVVVSVPQSLPPIVQKQEPILPGPRGPTAYSAYVATYGKNDFVLIVEDGIGTFFASFVEWVDIVVIALVLLVGASLFERFRK